MAVKHGKYEKCKSEVQNNRTRVRMVDGEPLSSTVIGSVILHGYENPEPPTSHMVVDVTEGKTKPFIVFQDTKDTHVTDLSQKLMDSTYGVLELVSHVQTPEAQRYNTLMQSVIQTVNNVTQFRAMYNLRVLTSATLEAAIYIIIEAINAILPGDIDAADEVLKQKQEVVFRIADDMSNILSDMHNRRFWPATVNKNSAYHDLVAMARVTEEATRITTLLADKVFDSLYAALFKYVDTNCIAKIADDLAGTFMHYRTNCMMILSRLITEQNQMNYFENIHDRNKIESYDDYDCEF